MPRRPAKAQQIADALAEEISAGAWPPGEWLPSWDVLAERYGAARGTVRSALEILAERGRVEVIRGRGAKVLPAEVARTSDHQMAVVGQWRGWHTASLEAGRDPYSDTTSIQDVAASGKVSSRLGVPVGTQVLERRRIHGLIEGGNKKPVFLSATWVAPFASEQLPILREMDTGPGGMTSRFHEIGLEVRWEDRVSSRLITRSESGELRVKSGSPALESWRRCYDQQDRIVEVTWRLINTALGGDQVYRYP